MTTEKSNKGSGQSLEATLHDVVDAPLSDVHLTTSVPREELRAFIARPETQARIREIVVARVGKEAPGELIEDLVQSATEDALKAKSPPRSMETARGWVGTVTVRAVVNHFRRDAAHVRWLRRDVEVEELPSEPDEPGEGVAPPWLLTGWLRPRVAGNPREQETYELLAYKAATGKTHAQVAADHAMTEGALKSRIHALKTKYEPQWRRRQRMLMLLILFGVAVAVAVIAWLLWPRDVGPQGSMPPRATPVLDRVFSGPLPVSHPRVDGGE